MVFFSCTNSQINQCAPTSKFSKYMSPLRIADVQAVFLGDQKTQLLRSYQEEIQQKMNTIPLSNSKKQGFHQKRHFFCMQKMGVKKHSSQNDTFRLVFEGGQVCTNFEFFRRKGAYMNLQYFKCLKSACKANARRMLQGVKTRKFTIIARFDLVDYKIYSTVLACI